MTSLTDPPPLGLYDMRTDIWGSQVISKPKSLLHGMFTFDVPQNQWLLFHGETEVATSAAIRREGGAGVIESSAAIPDVRMETRECPRYQPNRGHKLSSSFILPNPNADAVREFGFGTVQNGYFMRLTGNGSSHTTELVRLSGGVEKQAEPIDLLAHGIDLSKGNTVDLRMMWRGVGDMDNFINLRHHKTLKMLGTLGEMSIENPAMPVFMRVVRGNDDAKIICGCYDITSENGDDDYEYFGSSYAELVSVSTNTPVLIIYNPLTIDGKINTRTINLARVTVNASKRATFKLWTTRDASAITGATLQPIGFGSHVMTDSPDFVTGAVRATAVDTSKLRPVRPFIVEAASPREIGSPSERLKFPLVRGDYLIMTCTASAATGDVVFEWREEQ